MLKVNPKRFEYTHRWELIDPPSNRDWTILIFLQIADIWTTHTGLKYDCVEEANPVFGKSPTVNDMFLYKVAILIPAIEYDRKNGHLNKASIQGTNTFMTFVIANNLNVIHKAKRYCKKR